MAPHSPVSFSTLVRVVPQGLVFLGPPVTEAFSEVSSSERKQIEAGARKGCPGKKDTSVVTSEFIYNIGCLTQKPLCFRGPQESEPGLQVV